MLGSLEAVGRASHRLTPFRDPMAIAMNVLLSDWDYKVLHAFLLFSAIRKHPLKLQVSQGTNLTLTVPLWPCKDWFQDLSQMSIDTPCLFPVCKSLLRQPHFDCFHNSLQVPANHIQTIQQILLHQGYSRRVVAFLTNSRRHAMIMNDQSKWKR